MGLLSGTVMLPHGLFEPPQSGERAQAFPFQLPAQAPGRLSCVPRLSAEEDASQRRAEHH